MSDIEITSVREGWACPVHGERSASQVLWFMCHGPFCDECLGAFLKANVKPLERADIVTGISMTNPGP